MLADTANPRQSALAVTAKTQVGRSGYYVMVPENRPTKYAPNRIGAIRRDRGLTLQQLAELTKGPDGSPPDLTTIDKLEKSRMGLTYDWMIRVAEALGVTPTALIEDAERFAPVRRVPLLGSIPGGNWREAIEDPLALVPCEDGGPNTFALTVSGNSMGRVAPDGSRIYIDPDDIDLVDAALYAVMNTDGETTFKRYSMRLSQLEPVTDEPGHEPIKIGREPFTIVGRVVGGSLRFK